MKISELTTDQALDVFCEIAPYIANICIDENLTAELSKKLGGDGSKSRAEVMLYGAEKIVALVPILLKDHRADIYGILSAFNKKSIEENSKQNIITTSEQIGEICRDKELISFFKSFVG